MPTPNAERHARPRQRGGAIVSRMPVSTQEKAVVLGRVPLFAGISEDSMARLADVAGELEFPAGQHIVTQGQVGSGLYIILEGSVRVFRGSTEIARLGPGEFFGELSVIDQRPRMASVEALEDTRCLALASWDLLRLLETDPALSLNLIRGLAGRLRALGEHHHH
jgi:CRP/FNR family transcriptional regulator, cyclic AMP receptor protein